MEAPVPLPTGAGSSAASGRMTLCQVTDAPKVAEPNRAPRFTRQVPRDLIRAEAVHVPGYRIRLPE